MMRAAKRKTRAVVRRNKPSRQRALAMRKAPDLSLTEKVEQVLLAGDLTSLSAEERLDYYKKVCTSLGLNPLTRPFEYLFFRQTEDDGDDTQKTGKLVLYARRDCGDQLRRMHGIGITEVKRWEDNDYLYAEAKAQGRDGRTDSALAVVMRKKWKKNAGSRGGQWVGLTDRELANAKMKVETKAKRRATLSICGLGFMDESELDTMQVVGGVTREGRIYEYKQLPEGEPVAAREIDTTKIDEEAERRFNERAAQEDKTAQEQCQRVAETLAGDPFPTQDGPSLYYAAIEGTETFKIDGSASLKSEHGSELRKYWDAKAGAIIATPQQVGHLIRYFEERHVKFRPA